METSFGLVNTGYQYTSGYGQVQLVLSAGNGQGTGSFGQAMTPVSRRKTEELCEERGENRLLGAQSRLEARSPVPTRGNEGSKGGGQ